jgi:hypothetical protein
MFRYILWSRPVFLETTWGWEERRIVPRFWWNICYSTWAVPRYCIHMNLETGFVSSLYVQWLIAASCYLRADQSGQCSNTVITYIKNAHPYIQKGHEPMTWHGLSTDLVVPKYKRREINLVFILIVGNPNMKIWVKKTKLSLLAVLTN